MKIMVDVPRRGIRRLIYFVGLPVAVIMATALAARAYDTSWIAPGQQVSASRLKADLDEVQTRLMALEGRIIAKGPMASSMSVNGVYCGKSASLTTGAIQYGALTGYRAAKVTCENACASALAHMCSAEEVNRSFQVGALTPYPVEKLWYSSSLEVTSEDQNDCDGWECGLPGRASCSTPLNGLVIQTQSPLLHYDLCTTQNRIACCL